MTGELAISGGTPIIPRPLPTYRDSSGRWLGEEEKQRLAQVIDSGCLSHLCGTQVAEFERRFAELIGCRLAVATNSGTSALHTAILYLNPEPGDEILVSPITDMGTVIPILSQLALPVFVDVDPVDQNMNPARIEEAISERTRALIVTHMHGSPADMDAVMDIARRHNLFVIEDCAQAQLATYKGRTVGTMGDLACFSFQQSKHLTTGDGGMVLANQDGLFGRNLRHCMDKGWPRERGGRDHLFLAPNYHMTELQAAVGLPQLPRLEAVIAARRESARNLDSQLQDVPAVHPLRIQPDRRETRFFYVLTLDLTQLSVDGAAVVAALVAEGLPCFLGYPGKVPLYKYPMIRDHQTFGSSGWPFTLPSARRRWNYTDALCPMAELACRESVVIWWSERLTADHMDQIAAAVRKVIGAYRR